MKKLLLIFILLFITSDCFGVAQNYYVTPAGAGTKAGGSWANAMGYAEWETDFEASAEAGDIYYVAGGTYTLTSDLTTILDGTGTNPIQIIGVKTGTTNEPPVYSDHAFGNDRPVIDGTTNTFRWIMDNYWLVQNFIVHSDSGVTATLWIDTGNVINCKITNTNGAGGDNALYTGSNIGHILKSEFSSTNGIAIRASGDKLIMGCYIHDSATGIYCLSVNNIFANIIDTCTVGVDLVTYVENVIINNTFYNCTTGISATTAYSNAIINNIFDECTAPASWGTEQFSNFFDYNSWDGDSGANVNITEGANAIDSDITLTAPAVGLDFTVGSGSTVLDAGLQIGTNEGVTGDYKWNIGVDQDDNTAAGGGGTAGGWVSMSQ